MKSVAREMTRALIRLAGEKNRSRLCELTLKSMSESERDRFSTRNNLLSEGMTYRRLHHAGFRPTRILDVGAYCGEWTRQIKQVFPDANVLMIEAQESKEPHLRALATTLPGVSYYLGVVAAEAGERAFYELESGSSLLEEMSRVERTMTMRRVVTLDSIIGSTRYDLLKLDVQGAELMVLEGASTALRHAHAVQLEAQLIPINRGAPQLHDVITYMRERGFVPYDLFSPWRRAKDGALWSIDVLFLVNNSQYVGEPRYD